MGAESQWMEERLSEEQHCLRCYCWAEVRAVDSDSNGNGNGGGGGGGGVDGVNDVELLF